MNRRDDSGTYFLILVLVAIIAGAAYFQWQHETGMRKCEATGVSAEDCWRLLK